MKKLVMLEQYQGARKGDVVGFEHDGEADWLIEKGHAEAYDPEKHGEPGDDGKHVNPHGEVETITAADVGKL